jgi:hypothetical protein
MTPQERMRENLAPDDQVIECAGCSTQFLFSAGEASWFRERGLEHAPKRCKACRAEKRALRGAGW